MNSNKTRSLAFAASVIAAALLTIAVYSAVISEILLSGTIPDSQVFNGPTNVTVRILRLKPGEKLPWHYHPGYAFNIVKSGILTVEDGCGTKKTLTAGQGFEAAAGRVHRGTNASDEDVVVYDTFIIPQEKPTTVTFPDQVGRCGPPLVLNECSNVGWRKFDHPISFRDQRQCVRFVRKLQESRFQFQSNL